jgi:hypothetical protein
MPLLQVNARVCEFGDDETYRKMSVQYVPKNTKKNNDWAYKNFLAWLETRNRAHSDDPCPVNLLEPPWDRQAMASWLPRFACETRNTSGGQYPASTIVSLLSGLLRLCHAECPNFLELQTCSKLEYQKRLFKSEPDTVPCKPFVCMSGQQLHSIWPFQAFFLHKRRIRVSGLVSRAPDMEPARDRAKELNNTAGGVSFSSIFNCATNCVIWTNP